MSAVFPRDLFLLMSTYAAHHSANSLMRTCKWMLEFSRTPAFWQRTVRRALAKRLRGGRIHPLQFAHMDVFASRPEVVPALVLRQRVGWMFNSVLSNMCSLYTPATEAEYSFKAGFQKYHTFMIWDRLSGRGIQWTWSLTHIQDFGILDACWPPDKLPADHAPVPDLNVTIYPLHPTARRSVYDPSDGLYPIKYEIYDATHDRTWFGPGSMQQTTPGGCLEVVPREGLDRGYWRFGK